jgi:hypothetical protein
MLFRTVSILSVPCVGGRCAWRGACVPVGEGGRRRRVRLAHARADSKEKRPAFRPQMAAADAPCATPPPVNCPTHAHCPQATHLDDALRQSDQTKGATGVRPAG